MARKRPEDYLKAADAEERETRLGHLKIYLGAAPGVGKTYQMLSDALQKRAQGVDVVIGIVETHGREDVESLASAFERIPLKIVEKEHFTLYTLDIEAIIKRAPGLVLIDEAACTNPQGFLHPKRWQDIEDLIEKGFDVYTTLNIQHLESLNDVVGRLIGVPIYETIPDSFLEKASRIELIDLPSDELITRLKEGKIYVPKQISIAAHHFFKKKNLDALRELALRIAAERVSADVVMGDTTLSSKRLMYQQDRLLVCIHAGDGMPQLIRAAKRLASRLNCPWSALYIDTGRQKDFFVAQGYLDFAKSLGGSTFVVMATQPLSAIELFIEQHQITQLVLGQSSKPFWAKSGMAKKLSQRLHDMGIYFIKLPLKKSSIWSFMKPVRLKPVLLTLLIIPFAYGIAYMKNIFSPWGFGWVTGLFILSMAYFGAWRWVFLLMAFFLGMDILFNERSFDLLMYEPFRWLELYGSWSLLYLTLSAYLIHARREVLLARKMVLDNQNLIGFYQLSLNLRGRDKIIQQSCVYLEKQFHTKITFFVLGHQSLEEAYPKKQILEAQTKEVSILNWVYESHQAAGPGTGNFIYAPGYYLPVLSGENCLGIIRLDDFNAFEHQKKLFLVCLQHFANILEIDMISTRKKEQELHETKTYTRNDILKHLSRQLYKPFLMISEQMRPDDLNQTEWQSLIRLKNHLKVINFLSKESFLENKMEADIKSLIEKVLELHQDIWASKKITWHVERNLPQVWVQMELMKVVIENLLDNVVKHGEVDNGIVISISEDKGFLMVGIADAGSGLGDEELSHLFDSFYKGYHANAKGFGLGLAICERIVSWHGGRIWAENRKPKGAIFYFSIPVC